MFADDVWRYLPLGPVPSAVFAVTGLILLVHVARARSRRARLLAVVMLVATVIVVLAYTGRGALSNDDGGFAWRLGESIRSEWNNINRPLGMINIFGNVLMFLPVGWLVAVLAPRAAIVLGTLAGLGLSVLIEVWQMFSGSFGDVDDLLLNATGAAIGAIVAALLRVESGSARQAQESRLRAAA